MKYVMVVVALLLLLTGCSFSRNNTVRVDDIGATSTPTTLKSIEDLPKPATTPAEIRAAGAIRVIAESAKGQEQYDALAAARGVAQKNLLGIIDGVRVSSESLIKKGVLSEETIKLIVDGHVKAFDCGAFYNRANQTGYYCMELPLK